MSREETAADKIEALSMVMKEMVKELRSGSPNSGARVYWLRREVGYILRRHFPAVVGPSPSKLSEIDDEYRPLLYPKD